ncbi:PP2C family protein-serine/threonine phosphatase [Planctomonas psychrotolerans]|uniref:PP2C family protein-serine/threonine phosphatase n=1 Tax=Planctomonas psychrotolerans TaxID=2528712 RepID=UPI001239C6A8|nr:SpoIIE family protein phosphatase [Planctomonas psychrotolerans]
MSEAENVRRAVIVEDNDDIRRLLVQIVAAQGFTVDEAATGSAGLELIRSRGADLVTLDLNLPDLDGVEVCRRLREFSDAYVLMITARADEIDRLSGLDVGADDYLSKPFSPRELAARITALFRRPRSASAADAPGAEEQRRAAEVQRSLLPQQDLRVDGYEIAGRCRPARSVGGDFFDWYATREGLGVTVADAMGKGMGAALLAATVRGVLRSTAGQSDLDLAFGVAGAMLHTDLEQSGSFVTVFHARLDAASGLLSYVDAGHGLALHVSGAGLTRLPSSGPPVGAVADSLWASERLALAPGDALLVVSDGVLDSFDTVDAAMSAVGTAVSASLSVEDACDRILELASGPEVTDDVTAVMLRRGDG